MKYVVTSPQGLRINPGTVLGLTEKGAKDRTEFVKEAGKGRYEAVRYFDLKYGETFELDKLDKEIVASGRVAEAPAGEPKAEPKAEAKPADESGRSRAKK